MLRLPSKTTSNLICILCLIALLFLVTACSGSTASSPAQIQPEESQTPLPGEIAEWPENLQGYPLGQDLRFEQISVEQGLSQSTVFCILQDSQGFLWFGTEDGLNKFDGYSFTVFKHDPEDPNSLSANWIQTLYEDEDEIIWIGTIDGLEQFDPKTETFTHYRNDPDDPTSLSNNNVTDIIQDKMGAMWIGTDGGGINRYVKELGQFDHFQHDPDDPESLSSDAISAIHEDQNGILWVGTKDAGLNKVVNEAMNWVRYLSEPNDPDSLSHNNVSAISEDKEGALWVGTFGGGLNKLTLSGAEQIGLSDSNGPNSKAIRFQHFKNDPDDSSSLSSDDITAIYLDREDHLWIGTRDGGINIMILNKNSFSSFKNSPTNPHTISNNWILSIFQDREGVHWFGTIGNGVNKLNLGWRNFTQYNNIPNNPNSLGNNMVRTFHQEEDGVLWVGTMFGGLDKFNRSSGIWQHYLSDQEDDSSLSNNFISIIYKDRADNLWFGTASGLDRFNRDTQSFTHHQVNSRSPSGSPENNIRAIYESPQGVFWIGTRSGLYKFDLEENRWSDFDYSIPDDPHNLNNVWIVSLLGDNFGNLWVSTWGAGLFKIDLESELVTHYHHDPDDTSSLTSNVMLSGTQSRKGLIWFGTVAGLIRYDPSTDSFISYRENDGLPNDTVYCIVEDAQGNLWLSTNNGISKFQPNQEIFQSFDLHDGLQSNEFNGSACLTGENGEMFFGGINGFNIFYPDQVIDNPYIPPVVVTSISHDGVEADLISNNDGFKEVILKWPHNAFEFEYAALSLNQPAENQYAYYLEGFDNSWNEVGIRRFGNYTNIPGGTYTLRVKGSNNDGVWNEIGESIQITVVPPFWSAWWFQGILGIIVFGTAFGIYWLRVRNIKSRSRDLELLVEERTVELQREIDQRIQMEEALRDSEMEKAVSEERSRLARELHDSVTQSLYSLTLFTEAARHMAGESGSEEIEQTIKQIGTIGLHALKEMRLLVFELRPPELEKEGIASAIRKRLEAVEGRAGVDARLVVDGIFKLSGEVEQEFFRIAQEALNNSLKHASASKVRVYLRQANGRVEMEIVDDGIGFNPNAVADQGGMGLQNIQTRADALGGSLSITSEPDHGTKIKISIEENQEI